MSPTIYHIPKGVKQWAYGKFLKVAFCGAIGPDVRWSENATCAECIAKAVKARLERK